MASLSTDRNGNRKIQFTDGDGRRKTVYLGDLPQKAAEVVQSRIESILDAKAHGVTVAPEIAAWLAEVPDKLAGKLAAVGLIQRRQATRDAERLGAFIDGYIKGRECKPRTVLNMGRAGELLKEFFGVNRGLRSITHAEAATWREWMRVDKKLGINSSRRHVGRAKQFFRYAVKRKLVPENPFGEMASTLVANRARDRFITRAEADAVLDACPNAEWRLLFALSRYGGLRCPSEHFALRWQDVNWDKNRMTINSPKTEHHTGKEDRIIPIFPEVRPHLEAAFDRAPDGADLIFSSIGAENPGTHLKRIIRKAGLTPWPKLFHNLRASRETELTETYPIQTVVAWLGNSPAVALRHYLQVPSEHFDRAADAPKQDDVNSDAAGTRNRAQRGTLRNKKVRNTAEILGISHSQLPPTGVQRLANFAGKCPYCGGDDANSDVNCSASPPDLRSLVKAWEWLGDDERRLVLLAAGVELQAAVGVR